MVLVKNYAPILSSNGNSVRTIARAHLMSRNPVPGKVDELSSSIDSIMHKQKRQLKNIKTKTTKKKSYSVRLKQQQIQQKEIEDKVCRQEMAKESYADWLNQKKKEMRKQEMLEQMNYEREAFIQEGKAKVNEAQVALWKSKKRLEKFLNSTSHKRSSKPLKYQKEKLEMMVLKAEKHLYEIIREYSDENGGFDDSQSDYSNDDELPARPSSQEMEELNSLIECKMYDVARAQHLNDEYLLKQKRHAPGFSMLPQRHADSPLKSPLKLKPLGMMHDESPVTLKTTSKKKKRKKKTTKKAKARAADGRSLEAFKELCIDNAKMVLDAFKNSDIIDSGSVSVYQVKKVAELFAIKLTTGQVEALVEAHGFNCDSYGSYDILYKALVRSIVQQHRQEMKYAAMPQQQQHKQQQQRQKERNRHSSLDMLDVHDDQYISRKHKRRMYDPRSESESDGGYEDSEAEDDDYQNDYYLHQQRQQRRKERRRKSRRNSNSEDEDEDEETAPPPHRRRSQNRRERLQRHAQVHVGSDSDEETFARRTTRHVPRRRPKQRDNVGSDSDESFFASSPRSPHALQDARNKLELARHYRQNQATDEMHAVKKLCELLDKEGKGEFSVKTILRAVSGDDDKDATAMQVKQVISSSRLLRSLMSPKGYAVATSHMNVDKDGLINTSDFESFWSGKNDKADVYDALDVDSINKALEESEEQMERIRSKLTTKRRLPMPDIKVVSSHSSLAMLSPDLEDGKEAFSSLDDILSSP